MNCLEIKKARMTKDDKWMITGCFAGAALTFYMASNHISDETKETCLTNNTLECKMTYAEKYMLYLASVGLLFAGGSIYSLARRSPD
jgi:hypothetical protein